MSNHIQHLSTTYKSLGHKDIKTTMIYAHVLNRSGQGVRSPADTILHDKYRCVIRQKRYYTTCIIFHKNIDFDR